MGRICKLHETCFQFQNAQPHCDEHSALIIGAELSVCEFERLGGTLSVLDIVVDKCLGAHHEQSSRDTLAGDIGDQKAEFILSDQEIVVEIASHLFSCLHTAKRQIVVFAAALHFSGRQRRILYFAGVFQFLAVSVLDLLHRVFKRIHRRVNAQRQLFKLRVSGNHHFFIQVSCPDLAEMSVHILDLKDHVLLNKFRDQLEKHKEEYEQPAQQKR